MPNKTRRSTAGRGVALPSLLLSIGLGASMLLVTSFGSAAAVVDTIKVEKTAEHASIAAGDVARFTIVASAPSDLGAANVVLQDALPRGAGIAWSIDNLAPQTAPPHNGCSITPTGSPASLVLECQWDVIAAHSSQTV